MSISPGWVDQAPWGAAAADASQPTSLTKDFAHDDDAESPTQIASLGTQTCSEAPCCYSKASAGLHRGSCDEVSSGLCGPNRRPQLKAVAGSTRTKYPHGRLSCHFQPRSLTTTEQS